MEKKSLRKRKTLQNAKRKNAGITLIALVITIVVLVILATITINFAFGENGLIRSAESARDFYANDTQYTEESIANVESYIDGIISGIDWDEALANAEKHPEQVTSTAIGVGTDGKPVNMDLWEYEFDEITNGYGLNDNVSLETSTSADASKGYIGTDFSSIVIPQYISTNNGEDWTPVTNLDWLFYNCTELEKIDKLPDTVKSMRFTFRGCINLSEVTSLPRKLENMHGTFHSCSALVIAPSIPKSVTNVESTFSQCTSLINAPELPDQATSLYYTFRGCSSLKNAPEIPEGITNMQCTFYECTSLETPPSVIPKSVTNFYDTFYGCTKLSGTIEINGSFTGSVLENERLDYMYCFGGNAATSEGSSLILKCAENVYELFYDESRDNKISANVCGYSSNIILQRKDV